jgi:hypothetical protein
MAPRACPVTALAAGRCWAARLVLPWWCHRPFRLTQVTLEQLRNAPSPHHWSDVKPQASSLPENPHGRCTRSGCPPTSPVGMFKEPGSTYKTARTRFVQTRHPTR